MDALARHLEPEGDDPLRLRAEADESTVDIYTHLSREAHEEHAALLLHMVRNPVGSKAYEAAKHALMQSIGGYWDMAVEQQVRNYDLGESHEQG